MFSLSLRKCPGLKSLRGGWTALETSTLSVEGAASSGVDIQQQNAHVLPYVSFLHNRKHDQISLKEALRCLRAYSILPTPETVELGLNVNMALKKNKKKDPFRGNLVYPVRFGKEAQILLIAEEEVLSSVEGANVSGGQDIIDKLEKNPKSVEFDVCVCTPTMYEKMMRLQRTLRAKMPNPRRGNVVPPEEIEQTVRTFQQSKTFRCSKFGVINMAVGKLDFIDDDLESNIKCLVDSVSEHRGSLTKSSFIKRAVLSSNFGPGFHISFQHFL